MFALCFNLFIEMQVKHYGKRKKKSENEFLVAAKSDLDIFQLRIDNKVAKLITCVLIT